MNETIKNIELDLLFRIDFFALTGFGESEFNDHDKFEIEKQFWKDKFAFSKYYKRDPYGFEYIRLSELINPNSYKAYLHALNAKSLFNCCQLEQAIGVFESAHLNAFLAVDTGLCYNSQAHFDSVEEIIKTGTSNLGDLNTFYGKIIGNTIQLLYTPFNNNIDIEKSEEINSFNLNKSDFENELQRLKIEINSFFSNLKLALKLEVNLQAERSFIDEVFKVIN